VRRFLSLVAFALCAIIGCRNPVVEQLDEAKEDNATVKAERLLMYARVHTVKHDEPLTSIDALTQYAEKGDDVLSDPWGQKYQFTYVEDKGYPSPRIVIWTTHPKSGKVFAAPRELADKVKPGK
jgi:hypothetical protein